MKLRIRAKAGVDAAAERAAQVTPQELWSKAGTKTPGKCNDGQVIPEDWAVYPSGDMVLVNATVVGPHIAQTFGERTNTIASVLVATEKGGAGTNITYHLDTWYEIAEIRENNVVKATGGGDGFVFAAGKGAEGGMVSVTATARPRSDLRTKYGLTPENRYTDAVL